MRIPKRRGEWKQRVGSVDEYLTPDAIEGLKSELERIELARPNAVSELQRTREMGDLSENFAYSVAKGKVMGMDKRLFEIKEQLKRVKPLKIGGNAGGLIAAGSIVTVEISTRGGFASSGNVKTKKLTLVGTQQADPLSGKISIHSPVGAALMNHLSGDTVTVETNAKTIEYKIIKVS